MNEPQPNYRQAKHIRDISHRSWVNLHNAALLLMGKPHKAFAYKSVERSSTSVVRRIMRDAWLNLVEVEAWARSHRRR